MLFLIVGIRAGDHELLNPLTCGYMTHTTERVAQSFVGRGHARDCVRRPFKLGLQVWWFVYMQCTKGVSPPRQLLMAGGPC
jgi:hypothetical protein